MTHLIRPMGFSLKWSAQSPYSSITPQFTPPTTYGPQIPSPQSSKTSWTKLPCSNFAYPINPTLIRLLHGLKAWCSFLKMSAPNVQLTEVKWTKKHQSMNNHDKYNFFLVWPWLILKLRTILKITKDHGMKFRSFYTPKSINNVISTKGRTY